MSGRLSNFMAARRFQPWRYGAAFGIIAATTLVSEGLYRAFDTNRLSMVFLAGVLITAVTLGANPAYFAALLAFAIYNVYLVEPRFTFTFGTPEDVLVLLVFLGVAMLTGGLAGRLRDEAQRNQSRARVTGALFEASRRLSSASEEDVIRLHIVEQVAAAAKGEALMADQGQVWRSPRVEGAPEAAAALDFDALSAAGWTVRQVIADGGDLGLSAWRGGPGEAGDAEGERLINVLVDLGAAAVVRARLSAARAEVAAASRTEQLRNALLSSISHDLRTPLAAILASASSLKTFGGQFAPEVREDLVATIEEEAERLNRFVANLLSMTKLESGALSLERQSFDVVEVVNRVSERVGRTGATVLRRLEGERFLIDGDPILLEQALGNLLENAVRYGFEGGTVLVRVSDLGAAIMIEVQDEGPGVPESDLQRIFEKFYRSPASTRASQGTGLGLSIARGLVEAMNGSIAASNRGDGQGGLVVAMLFAKDMP